MSKGSILITNIQRMCFHDGPGIRTTVFLKGCNLHCPWCANPENISVLPQNYERNGKRGTYGREYSDSELLEEILKDRNFFGEEGGVTFSGGEPLLQIERLRSVLTTLHQRGISIAMETALQIPYQAWKDQADDIDHYLIDLKILKKDICNMIIGGDADCYRANVRFLHEKGKDMIFRIPLNHEYTLKEDNLCLIEEFLEEYKDVPVEIFATHMLGNEKYKSLGLEEPVWEKVTDTVLDQIKERFEKRGIRAKIARI
ncbi:MAG: radical SAM protein [Lachnospiraceae bacterium]|nr:radical SAM protein [Lachnospiraceae bacterium]